MSLMNGGLGCTASKGTLASLVGCNYDRLCSTLSELVGAGLLHKEQRGRSTVYRVIYSPENDLLFGKSSGPQPLAARQVIEREIACEVASLRRSTTCRLVAESGGNPAPALQQYIPLNGKNRTREGCDDGANEPALRQPPMISAEELWGLEGRHRIHGHLSAFERGFRQNWTRYNLAAWLTWLADVHGRFARDPTLSARAQRLLQAVEEVLPFASSGIGKEHACASG